MEASRTGESWDVCGASYSVHSGMGALVEIPMSARAASRRVALIATAATQNKEVTSAATSMPRTREVRSPLFTVVFCAGSFDRVSSLILLEERGVSPCNWTESS